MPDSKSWGPKDTLTPPPYSKFRRAITRDVPIPILIPKKNLFQYPIPVPILQARYFYLYRYFIFFMSNTGQQLPKYQRYWVTDTPILTFRILCRIFWGLIPNNRYQKNTRQPGIHTPVPINLRHH